MAASGLRRGISVLGLCSVISASPLAQSSKPSKPLDPSAVFSKASPAVVTIRTPEAGGSGVLIDAAGVIVTNLHVLRGADRVTVTLANGDAYDDVNVVAFDARKDLALLKVSGFKLPTAELADSDTLTVGQKVYTIGAPKGLDLTLAEGLVSGMRDSGEGYRVVQTSAPISPGSSGGGLFDEEGRLIGITTFKVRGGENLNFALPINYVRGMLGTTARYTLAELAKQIASPSGVGEQTRQQPASTATGIPRLAPAYRTVEGNLVVVEQSTLGASVRMSFSNPYGYIYGSAELIWSETAKAFKGNGTLATVCGSFDTRIWMAPVVQEVYVVNDRVIRDRWTQPLKVNCDRQRVDSVSWQEVLWYVPDEK